ncbi:TonB-dependent receptor plug domain-containing protein [Sphingomonas oleivorans]|nr:TonB-dependent receptor [Sphingomonas oleivorans]
MKYRKSGTAIAVMACFWSASALAQQNAPSPVTRYSPDFFARSQPYSALDMVALLPGFSLDSGNADIRGYAGSAGNVLIDGARPASKQESLEEILRRIPANAVERIELIRGSVPGIDMQGRAVIANIVRVKAAMARGRMEAGAYIFRSGLLSPRIAAEASHRSGDRLIEASIAYYREYDDQHGPGSRDRLAPDGTVLRDADYRQDEGDKAIEATGNYEDRLWGGKLRLNGSFSRSRTFADIEQLTRAPVAARELIFERARKTAKEFGLQYARDMGARTGMELVALHRAGTGHARTSAFEGRGSDVTRTDTDAPETIVRAVLRRRGALVSLEGGLEGALNILDSYNRLEEDGVAVPLPAAHVRIEERRVEPFVTSSWQFSPSLSLEAGLRFESSTLIQRGDSSLRKSLAFAKPRLLASWSPGANDQIRLLFEREVGQLDFANFVTSSSLATGTVTAGNPDLEPDRTWRHEVALEHRFWTSGSLLLTVRRERIDNLVDRLPVVASSTIFDAVGNIGRGARLELAADLSLPLDRMGLPGMLIKANVTCRRSHVIDPATGERRHISDDAPLEGELHFTHDLPRWRARWGVDVVLPTAEREFRFNEIRTDRIGTQAGIFAEYRPDPVWNVRIFARNLIDSSNSRERIVFGGLRGTTGRAYVETRLLGVGPYVGFTVQRSFGK